MIRSNGEIGKIRIILPIVLVALIAGGYLVWNHLAGLESTDDAQVDGHVHAINTRIGGTIVNVNVQENQLVEAGAVLIQIDDRDYKIALAKATADLADAQAGLEEARAALPQVSAEAGGRISSSDAAVIRAQGGFESVQRDLDVARARVNTARAESVEAQANYAKAAKDLDRMKPLIAKDEISQLQYDAVAAAAEASKAVLDSRKAAIAEAESHVAAADARIKEARGTLGIAESEVESSKAAPQQVVASRARIAAGSARVQQAQAAVDQAMANLEYATVRAPVAGIVSRRNVEAGQVIPAGHPVLAIVPLTDIWVTANFKETQLDVMRVGQQAEITVDAYGGAKFMAHVDSISAATGGKFSLLPAENSSGNFVKVVQRIPVKLVLNAQNTDPQHVLRPGMSVGVSVLTGPK